MDTKRVLVNSLSHENMMSYVDGNETYQWPICPQLKITLAIDIPKHEMSIVGPWDGSIIDASRMANCDFYAGADSHENGQTFRLTLSQVNEWFAYYQFLDMVVRNLALPRSLASSFSASLEEWAALLASENAMSLEKEIGLFGELIFLEALLNFKAQNFSLDAWTGPHSEEHDFKFPLVDVEVKTTVSESRTHKISSLTQLVPSPGKGLFLMSVQLTRGGVDARNLPALVDTIIELLPTHLQEKFTEYLNQVDYSGKARDLYRTVWGLRTLPRFYLVDEYFPKLVEENLAISEFLRPLISEISYRIAVDTVIPKYPHIQGFLDGEIDEGF